jgi:hypothetical protein
VALSYVGSGPQEAPAQWFISVNYDPGLNLVKRLFHKPDFHLECRLEVFPVLGAGVGAATEGKMAPNFL